MREKCTRLRDGVRNGGQVPREKLPRSRSSIQMPISPWDLMQVNPAHAAIGIRESCDLLLPRVDQPIGVSAEQIVLGDSNVPQVRRIWERFKKRTSTCWPKEKGMRMFWAAFAVRKWRAINVREGV